MFKKIKKWLSEIGKEKCPHCNKIGFKDNERERNFIEKATRTSHFYTPPHPLDTVNKSYSPHSQESSVTTYTDQVEIYNIKYLCKSCNLIIEQKVEIIL